MKKLYTMVLAAAVTLSAAAAAPQLKVEAPVNGTLKTLASTKQESNRHEKQIISMQRVADLNGNPVSPLNLEEDGTYSLEGYYDILLGDYYFQTSVGEVVTYGLVEYDAAQDVYWLEDLTGEYFFTDVPMVYDEATQTLEVVMLEVGNVNIGGGQYAYSIFAPFEWSVETNIGLVPTIDAAYDPTTGMITFPADCGFAWPAFADNSMADLMGWFGLYDFLGAMQSGDLEPLDEVQEGQWQKIASPAVFCESWFTPLYSYEGADMVPSDWPYEVELHQDVTNPNRFRLWKPFTTENYHLIDTNYSQYEGQIVFDISDPDHVVVEAGMPAGYNDLDNGEFYVFGMLGWQIFGFGDQYNEAQHKQLIIDFMEEHGQEFDTYDAATRTVHVNSAVFDIDKSCGSAYSWRGVNYSHSTITLPASLEVGAVNDIAVDSNNAPVEFYNLQGVRVDKAAAGTLVIKKQGDKVSKMIVR